MIDFRAESSSGSGKAKVTGQVDSGQALQTQLTQAFNPKLYVKYRAAHLMKDGLASFARACPAERSEALRFRSPQ